MFIDAFSSMFIDNFVLVTIKGAMKLYFMLCIIHG